MRKSFHFLAAYAAAFFVLILVMEAPSGAGADVPPLPVEASLTGAGEFCGSRDLRAALGGFFRWVAGETGPVWRRGLSVSCTQRAGIITLTASAGRGRPAASERVDLSMTDAGSAAAFLAASLWASPALADAAVRAHLENQRDVARAGADLWKLGRWSEAADTLSAALENDWDEAAQAQLYFGLADAYAHLGRPRQAYWYALAYWSATPGKAPPQDWVKGLRGLSGLVRQAAPSVEPRAQTALRRYREAQARRQSREAFEALHELAREAPWSADYQETLAAAYERLGWERLSESWKRRAARTRRLAADATLQARLAALVR